MNVDVVRSWEFPVVRQTYTAKDVILYALGLGYGADPTSEEQLRYVFERDLLTVPTMVTTLCHPGFWVAEPAMGIDVGKVIHGEHRVTFHAPIPTAGTVRGQTRITDVIDKGAGKGAQIIFERVIHDDATGEPLASIEQLTVCRGDGGFAGGAGRGTADATTGTTRPARPPATPTPDRAPDRAIDIPILPQAALLYRLCADPNPLHADPATARAAGFDRPILHGLCTYGVAARALIEAACGNDPNLLHGLDARFSAPVFPGETLRTEIWRGQTSTAFRCLVKERNVVVIANGVARVGQRERPS